MIRPFDEDMGEMCSPSYQGRIYYDRYGTMRLGTRSRVVPEAPGPETSPESVEVSQAPTPQGRGGAAQASAGAGGAPPPQFRFNPYKDKKAAQREGRESAKTDANAERIAKKLRLLRISQADHSHEDPYATFH